MQRYVLKRIGQGILVVFVVSIIIFMLARLSGDPAVLMAPIEAKPEDIERIREILGLNEPLYVQYGRFALSALKGEFGISMRLNRPAMEVWLERIPNTLMLGAGALLFAFTVGIGIGLVSAIKMGTWFDNFGKVFALLGQSIPSFWLALMLMLLFAVQLRWLPTSGTGDWRNVIMPSFSLGWIFCAAQCRISRSSMLDVLDSEYVKMARIKGVPEFWVMMKHALKNASLPIITLMAMNMITLVNGTVVIETIFNWPGIGRLVIDSIYSRDYTMVQTCVFIASVFFVTMNILIDIIYAYVDPRIRFQ
ncbi:MAG: ABC transporter permease [Chloroflexota bacterium]